MIKNRNEIEDIKSFHLPTLHEGIRQAELRLNYAIDRKDKLDNKALILLSMFVLLNTAFFTLYQYLMSEIKVSMLVIILSAIYFFVSVFFLLLSLKSRNYGAIGRYPDTWLHKVILSGDDNTMGYILTHILLDYQKAIAVSDDSNDKKLKWLEVALALFAFLPFLPVIIVM